MKTKETEFIVTVTLIVADIARSVAFYRDVLGATVLREGEDPKGRPYFWLSEQRINSKMELDAESDYAAIFAGEVSVTPLHLDPTHTESLSDLSPWAKRLEPVS